LQALLNENSARTLEKLAEALNVDKSAISDHLHTMGNIQKEIAYGFHINCLNWLFKII